MKMKRGKKIDEDIEVEVTVDGVWNKIGNKKVDGGKEMIISVSKTPIRKTFL